MHQLTIPTGVIVSFDHYGTGPPLVLVHGSFSDHQTNWDLVKPMLSEQFTVYALARRGRGDTEPSEGHDLWDEAGDVSALIDWIDRPVFLLGHSYGAHVALATAARKAGSVEKLVLYEPPHPDIPSADERARLEDLIGRADWEAFTLRFFRDTLQVPDEELKDLRTTELWPPMVADAAATWGDIQALAGAEVVAEEYRALQVPVLLQVGTESPREVFFTDTLASVLPNARIDELTGQAHEGMTTAPEMYAESVIRFLGASDSVPTDSSG